MKIKFTGLLTLVLALVVQISFAQTKEVTGTVTDGSGVPLPGVNIVIQGTTTGTQTDFDGNYAISASTGETLVFSYVGFGDSEQVVGASNTINVTLQAGEALDEVVVTALGISREKKTLGYATEEVSGDQVSTVTQGGNIANSLSGKVSGLQIKRNSNIGGSTNVLLRGTNSLTGNNQALFVVDGVIIDNSNTNGSDQQEARGGFDYGNAASDINPDNIASVNVLKGAAATALYGNRASNGAIIITTKKGTKNEGIGVSINSGIQIGRVNKETFAKYQSQYGAGYGPGFLSSDVDGDGTNDRLTYLSDDASYGSAFDPSLLVYQWDALFDPTSPTFGQATPWTFAGDNGPISFFDTAVTLTNSVAVSGGTEKSAFRLNYSKFDATGIMPNSEQNKNTINFNGSHDFTDKLSVSTNINFVNQKTLGRNSTGYSNNIISNFRQWAQTNVNFEDQRRAYERTGRNYTWNYTSPTNDAPIYWDNPYYSRYENYQNDERNRVYGNVALTYDVTDWFNVVGRVTMDSYDELQEERTSVGSNPVAKYSRFNRTFREYNYDLIMNFDTDISDDISFNGILGTNIRRNNIKSIYAITNGGLVVPGVYSLSNSENPIEAPIEQDEKIGVDGVYAQASFGFYNKFFLEGTIRRDATSTLPEGNNSFYYPSVTGSYIFSNDINADWLSFGKLRLNYAEVGTGADFAQLRDVFAKPTKFGDANIFSVSSTRRNPDLKEERLTSYEGGLELDFFKRRLGLDVSFYKTNTKNQVLPLQVSGSTGYTTKIINSGELQNKGVEVSLNATPLMSDDFKWDIRVNFARNRNKLLSLDETDNIVLGDFQGGVTLNGSIGQPFGIIKGSDYATNDNGERIIDEDGLYTTTSPNTVIGNVNPDYTGGVFNSFTYKNLSLSFLIDVQKGGSVFSLDQYYGQATGLYPNTAFTNDLGNPVRNTIANGGGVIFDGVTADGSPNTTRVDVSEFGVFGYSTFPNSEFVYDASYVKLREVALSYSLPTRFLDNLFFTKATFTLTGSNLWIIHKNVPYADPEAGLSSGNLQGYQSGVLPTTRDYGFNVSLQF
ncbi:SusC/RagA family TonB-linked outer membrane protein [Leeuwenhoekiella marinoflava]|uniref:TonB-linked SusC/RagA family outer membrane protein n=2 Tax=Leeuwenhoekiella marinoflava TaxID=988 RepID=A0A4Q0PKC9_9FLAO|nr:SusC/RagA family TonB-linked outer membrane protein [Leeuwenhoekiella marinoflava]RXG27899.1 TonB-linked SusC/RagA family outer membrane protein [Leeuwenhoekiella marinoflava]SHF61969.1 TonB-linked outer membrane protein, SusC/RagA family [Leeuwenhoekiella marinoflava DSM 3653]